MNDVRGLEGLVHDCLRVHYGLVPVRVQLLSVHSFNTIFRVDTADDKSVLRVGAAERIHPVGVEDIEAAWLDSLADSGFETARNLPTLDGSRWASVAHPDVLGDRTLTRFSWVGGVELRSQFDESSAFAAGQVLALLHRHAVEAMAAISVPRALHARSAVYFGSQNLVAEHESEHGGLFCEAIARVQTYVDSLWTHGDIPHLLHGDFGPHNVLTEHGVLRPIDFQDLRYGFAVQDLGISLSDLSRTTPELRKPFTQGYAAISDLPDMSPEILDSLAAARDLNIMNLALLSPASGIGATFDRHADRVVTWMKNQT